MKPALLACILAVIAVGCTTTPKTSSERDSLKTSADAALKQFEATDPTLTDVLKKAHGYAIFPDVGKGGFIAGAAFGRGTVYEGQKLIGYADLRQGSIGAQIGGMTFTELVVFQTPEALYRFKNNNFTFSASATAVAVQSGAAGTQFKDGSAIFIKTTGGLMADASLAGQQFTFVPVAVAEESATRSVP